MNKNKEETYNYKFPLMELAAEKQYLSNVKISDQKANVAKMAGLKKGTVSNLYSASKGSDIKFMSLALAIAISEYYDLDHDYIESEFEFEFPPIIKSKSLFI